MYSFKLVPHIGHLYSSVIADTLKRYYALKGFEASLTTGTDEHGLKIQQAAVKNNCTPIELCDRVSNSFKKLCDKANIDYTTFMRTTEPRHAKAVQHLWNILLKEGYIYKGQHEGWYAVSDEAFYPENQVTKIKGDEDNNNPQEEKMVAIESGQPVEWMVEENYKFKLSAFQKPLLDWIHNNPQAIVPSNRKNEVVSWIEAGLEDLSISRLRSRLDWGIPVPNDPEQHTIYVWLDALTNYITAKGYPSNSKDINAKVHVVGKDILRFHAVYWPAFLMAAKLPLPEQILAHAHWTMNKSKMSKSKGNVADPFLAMDTFGVDAVRYYLMKDGGFADDGDYSEEELKKRYKKDLAGQLGNLLNRSIGKSLNPMNQLTTTALTEVDKRDQVLHDKLVSASSLFDSYFEEREFSKALNVVMDILSEANKYFTDNEPWNLKQDQERLNTVLYYSLESCRISGILLQPIMPTKMKELLNRLGVPENERSLPFATTLTKESRSLGPLTKNVLFPKL
ncbi:tRNA synthetases class I (M)-domain-containing protein [Cunninghamella echinulata]|nr:tRNA synthetases class I (M)-domain-containing protein [Cunninghamella echinulata]